jgi:hypothetical protein
MLFIYSIMLTLYCLFVVYRLYTACLLPIYRNVSEPAFLLNDNEEECFSLRVFSRSSLFLTKNIRDYTHLFSFSCCLRLFCPVLLFPSADEFPYFFLSQCEKTKKKTHPVFIPNMFYFVSLVNRVDRRIALPSFSSFSRGFGSCENIRRVSYSDPRAVCLPSGFNKNNLVSWLSSSVGLLSHHFYLSLPYSFN